MSIVDGSLSLIHANFNPHPPSAAVSPTTSPVTEVFTAYFHEHSDSYVGAVDKAFKTLKDKAEGCKATARGWVVEEVEDERVGKGKKGRAFVGCIGWESVEAHMRFRETEGFKKIIPLLREGTLGLEVHHTKFQEK